MTNVGDAFAAGDLAGALAAATAEIRARPRESGLRWLLAELLLFNGEVERADRALDAVLIDEPSPAVLEFRQLLRAEEIRRQVFRDGRVPQFQGDDATPAQAAALRTLTLARAGDPEAVTAVAEVESLRPHVAGEARHAGGTIAFDDLRDGDDILAPQIEVLTVGGDYMWVPVERLASLVLDPPRRPRDLYWRRSELTLKDGTEGLVYLPLVYTWTDAATPLPLRLGRETDWTGPAGGPVRGLGQRMLLVGEEALPVGDLSALHFT